MRDPRPPAGKVAPSVGLALLESLRAADTPEGDIPGESDLPLALRRRLGLSPVVEEQIRRYARLRERDGLAAEEVVQLFELIGKRPDARQVLSDAGRRLARRRAGESGGLRAKALPRGMRQWLALRRTRRIARGVSPNAQVTVRRKPPSLTIRDCLAAAALEGGAGCALIGGLIQEMLDNYGVTDLRPVHPACEAAAQDRCLWELEDKEPAT